MEELGTNETTQKAVTSQSETFQKRWFCVALSPSGNTVKMDAESPAAFLEVLSQSTVAWSRRWTDDFDKDAPVVAAQLGFSERLSPP